MAPRQNGACIMSRFAIVAPPNILQTLKACNTLGDCHLLLAHDIVKKEEEYHDLFNHLGQLSPRKLIILDNSVIETGNAVNVDVVAHAASIVNPTCVVLPDVMLNPK